MHATLPARVYAIDPVVDAARDTFRVGLSLPDSDNMIPARTRCSATPPDAAVGR